jgi:hypothetical protein
VQAFLRTLFVILSNIDLRKKKTVLQLMPYQLIFRCLIIKIQYRILLKNYLSNVNDKRI